MTILSTTLGKKWSSPHSQQESPKHSSWVPPQKQQNDLILFLRQTFNITIIQVDTLNTDAKEAEVDQFYEDL